jgi:hypothetical protein
MEHFGFKGQNDRFSIEPCIKDGGNAGGEQEIKLILG